MAEHSVMGSKLGDESHIHTEMGAYGAQDFIDAAGIKLRCGRSRDQAIQRIRFVSALHVKVLLGKHSLNVSGKLVPRGLKRRGACVPSWACEIAIRITDPHDYSCRTVGAPSAQFTRFAKTSLS